MKSMKLNILGVAVALAYGSAASAFAEDTVTEALKEGDVTLSFRMRNEQVETDGADDADLTSLKTRLTYSSGDFQGFKALIEMDDVTYIGDDDDAAGILDPEGTEINQAYLSYTLGGTTATYGRQRILLDNQRFVGGVGFRQNEQTYDAFSVRNKSLPDTEIFLSYVFNVNRIFGEDDVRGDNKSDTYLLNAKYSGFSFGSFTGYAYLIDNEDVAAFSTDTYGVRFAGATGDFGYALEYATQSDAADNPASYDADYMLAEGSYTVGGVKLLAGYEVLGSDGTDGQFITPLATLHKFQGWDDKFLGGGSGNILGGIKDMYFSASTNLAGFKLAVVYHDMESDDSSASGMDDLGSEVGLLVGRAFGPMNFSVKYSEYSADDFSTDTEKLWLTAEAKF